MLELSQFLLQCRTVCSLEGMSQFSEQKNTAVNWHQQDPMIAVFIPQSKDSQKNELLGRKICF